MDASIIVPVFNAEKTIASCLTSLQNQNFSGKFEIIVVDDGSTDNSLNVVKNFKKIKILKQKNSGPAVARNFGAQKASGKIIVFVDSDCVASEYWLKEMLKPFQNPNVAGVQGAYKTKQKEFMARFIQIEIESRYERLKRIKSTDWIGSYSAAYRKKIFLKEHGFSSDFKQASGEDPELSYKLNKKGHQLVFNSDAIVFHQHPVSFFHYLKKKFTHAYWRILLYKKHSDKMVRDSYTPQTLKIQLFAILAFILFTFLSFFAPIASFFGYLALILLVLSMLPFVFFAISKDFAVGFLSPLLILARNFVFLTGLLTGFISSQRRF